MKKLIFSTAALLACSLAAAQSGNLPGRASTTASPMKVVAPEALQWSPIIPGAEMAVVAGDPAQAGAPYVLRIRCTDGSKIPPHWHPGDENITVLKGTFLLGMGEKFDLHALRPLTPGNYAFVPKEMRHFGLNNGETIVQVHGTGPFKVNFVNPADDPANQAKK